MNLSNHQDAKKRIPGRTCIGCGAVRDKKDLIRIVRVADGSFHIDPGGKTGGRGCYLCRDPKCLDQAVRRRGLDRSFHQSIPAGVYDALRKELTDGSQ